MRQGSRLLVENQEIVIATREAPTHYTVEVIIAAIENVGIIIVKAIGIAINPAVLAGVY
jgi:DNA-binding protein